MHINLKIQWNEWCMYQNKASVVQKVLRGSNSVYNGPHMLDNLWIFQQSKCNFQPALENVYMKIKPTSDASSSLLPHVFSTFPT